MVQRQNLDTSFRHDFDEVPNHLIVDRRLFPWFLAHPLIHVLCDRHSFRIGMINNYLLSGCVGSCRKILLKLLRTELLMSSTTVIWNRSIKMCLSIVFSLLLSQYSNVRNFRKWAIISEIAETRKWLVIGRLQPQPQRPKRHDVDKPRKFNLVSTFHLL